MSFKSLSLYIFEKYPHLKSKKFKEGYVKNYTRELATENLLLFKTITDKYNLKYWLSFGTLLSIYRDGKLLEIDWDVDLATTNDEGEWFIGANDELFENGFEPVRFDMGGPLISWGRNGLYIDLYGYNKINENEWKCSSFKIENEQIEDLSVINFKGLDFNAPKDIEKYLIIHYGESWKIPQQGITAKING